MGTAQTWVILACALIGDGPVPPKAEKAVLSEAVGNQWLTRLRGVIPGKSWSVRRDGDIFEIARTEKIEFVSYANAPAGLEGESADERRERLKNSIFKADFRIRMKFAPKMTMAEYEKLVAINDDSAQQVEKLREGLSGIPQKIGSFSPRDSEEVSRLRKFNAAVEELPYRELPELYCDEFSIHFTPGRNDGDMQPYDDEIREECESVELSLLTLFGTYDTRIAAGERRPHWNETKYAFDRTRGIVAIPSRLVK